MSVRPGTRRGVRGGVRGRVPVAVLLVAAAGTGLLAWWWQAQRGLDGPRVTLAATAQAQPPAPAEAPAKEASTPAPAARPGPPLSAIGEAQRREQLALWQGRLERARQVHDAYRAAAQYPHESRPIEEHPDQVRPFAPIEEERSLRMPGGTATQGVRLKTSQERVFASGPESSRVTVRLEDLQGRALPLVVRRAVMKEVTPPGRTASTAEFSAPFNDTGQAGDAVPGDGTWSVLMQPAVQGFGGFAGTVRLELHLEHAGQPGFLYFDLTYSPELAATWLPGVREAVEDGSLAFYLPVQVRMPGRYVVSARVDDAQGRPVALALFNQELKAGEQAIRLPVFGKLIRDKQPAFPLRLRDVEAFLLKPDAFPDRVMLPRRAGLVHTSQTYPLARFSTEEWQSEERTRYLTELGKDVREAEQRLKQLGP